MNSAVFLDRDGTIIEDRDYPRRADEVALIPHAAESLRLLQEAGFLLFVVSNQSGVGRGRITDEEFRAVHQRFDELLRAEGVAIEEYGYCLHTPDQHCRCRKPEPELVERMVRKTPIELERSFVIGDKACDVELGLRLGARAVLVGTGKGMSSRSELENAGTEPARFCASIREASAWILANRSDT